MEARNIVAAERGGDGGGDNDNDSILCVSFIDLFPSLHTPNFYYRIFPRFPQLIASPFLSSFEARLPGASRALCAVTTIKTVFPFCLPFFVSLLSFIYLFRSRSSGFFFLSLPRRSFISLSPGSDCRCLPFDNINKTHTPQPKSKAAAKTASVYFRCGKARWKMNRAALQF